MKIDRDEGYERDYIPLPGGWEVQTKGRGSSFRICDTKSGERVNVPDERVQKEIERMAREAFAAHAETQRELAACKQAIVGLLEAMEMQEKRESGDFHISQPSARFIWDAAKNAGRELLAANAQGERRP